MKIMPRAKRRTKSKVRIDVATTNQNRLTVKSEILTVRKTNGVKSSTLKSAAIGFADASECLADEIVMLPLGKQTLSIKHNINHCKALARVARKHGVTLRATKCNRSGIVTDVSGDNLPEFCNHVAGHSDLRGVEIILATQPIASTGTDGHVRDAIQFGFTSPPKRIDYTAGRNQPKASYPIDNRYTANEIGHTDTRNENKRAGLRAPDIPHTEH
jgi:hypothetical protein